MCNHNVDSNKFKYCPYCGEQLPQTSKQDNYPCYAAYSWGQLETYRISFQEFDWHAAADYIVKKCTQENKSFLDYFEPMKRIVNMFNTDAAFTSEQTNEEQGTTSRLFNAGLLGVVGKIKTQICLYDDVYKEVEINKYCINPKWNKILDKALYSIQADLEEKYLDARYKLEQLADKRNKYLSIQI